MLASHNLQADRRADPYLENFSLAVRRSRKGIDDLVQMMTYSDGSTASQQKSDVEVAMAKLPEWFWAFTFLYNAHFSDTELTQVKTNLPTEMKADMSLLTLEGALEATRFVVGQDYELQKEGVISQPGPIYHGPMIYKRMITGFTYKMRMVQRYP